MPDAERPCCVPTLGYPTKTAAIEALMGDGRSLDEIVELVGGSRQSVISLQSFARKRIADRKVILPRATQAALTAAADAYGLSVNDLVLHLLDVIIRDDVFEALLGEPDA